MSKDTLSLQDKGAGCSENVVSTARRGAETRAQGHTVPVLGCDPAMAGLGGELLTQAQGCLGHCQESLPS